jgi:thiol-disulfide isomerase/thioredoxin
MLRTATMTATSERRTRGRRGARIVVEIAAVVAVVVALGWWQTRRHARGPLPPLTLAALDGGTVSLRDALVERPTVIAFFAPWCGVCKAMSGNVRWIREHTRARIVSVAAGYQHPAEVRAYVRAHDVASPVLLDPEGEALRAFGVAVYPTFFFVDERGQITGSASGYTTTFGLLARLWR